MPRRQFAVVSQARPAASTCEKEESDEPPGTTGSVAAVLEEGASSDDEWSPGVERLNGRFEGIGSTEWGDWRWQMRHRIRSLVDLGRVFPSAKNESGAGRVTGTFPMALTPYYASLIRRTEYSDPVFAMSVPNAQELIDSPALVDDPLEEEEDMPVPGLVHRYGDRALLIATTTCGSYCRHCTRKRVAGSRECTIGSRRLGQAVSYLREHPEIADVIVSGGDPLTMATETLEVILRALREVPSVQIVRIGTRTPVVLPQRITRELTEMLRRYHPLWINTHFNHPQELTEEAGEACARLADAGIPLGNQSVLLRGVNDDPKIIAELCRGLVRMRVRPYYLFQCDLVRGVEHFRTPVSRGIEIMEYLRGRMSGIAIPTFVVDAPHGGGKIPVLPTYIVSTSPTHTVLRNYEGMLVSYPEPYAEGAGRGAGETGEGVWELATGRQGAIEPARAARLARRRMLHAELDR